MALTWDEWRQKPSFELGVKRWGGPNQGSPELLILVANPKGGRMNGLDRHWTPRLS